MHKSVLFFIAILLCQTSPGKAHLHLEGIQIGSSFIRVIPMNGSFTLEEGSELEPVEESYEKTSYLVPLSYPVQYVRLVRLGQAIFLPVTEGEQTYRFLNDTTNLYETTNSFQRTYLTLQQIASRNIDPYRNSLNEFDSDLNSLIPAILDTLNSLIRNHPYENELKFTFIHSFHYHLSKKLLPRKEIEKLNRAYFGTLDQTAPLFSCWGYNKFVSILLEDYYVFSMNAFNYPFRAYKAHSLPKFIFDDPLFTHQELNNYLSFYKIQRLENSNDKNMLFTLADSLSTLTKDPYLRAEIDRYREASITRIQPQMKAPDFFLKEAGTQNLVRLHDIETIVVLDFWATWCAPCVKSLPKLGKLNNKYQDSVRFISISLDNDEKKVIDFLQQKPDYTWTFLFDGQNGPTGTVYEAKAIPKYIIINEAGIIVLEAQNISEIEAWLKKRFK